MAALPLDVRDLSTTLFTRRGTLLAVDRLSLAVAAGETLALVGESGCGKSLSALSVMRLLPDPPARITGGAVRLNGRDLVPLPEEAMLAAMSAAELLSRAARDGSSPYLARKLVEPEACRFLPDGTLVLPLMRYDLPVEQRLRAVQRILPNGRKLFTKGFEKPGCCVRLGSIDPKHSTLLMVGEGYATCLTARMATSRQHPVFVALDAGNLMHVVLLLRALYPEIRILLLADDDWLTKDQHSGELVNPGRSAARAAAKKVDGCDFVTPIFAPATREQKDTDFNDLHVREGLDAVRRQLSGVITAMQRRYG